MDVVIIGAGITGALVAHELCQAGLRCCVVDKRSIATGSSAASTALLQYEIDTPLCKMTDMIGEKAAVMAYKSCLKSITDLEQVFKETHVASDFERIPSIFYASDKRGVNLIEKEYKIRKKHGLPTELLDSHELFRNCRFEAPCALFNKESAQMDAYKAATGLLRHHMHESKLQVFTHTEIIRWRRRSDGYELATDNDYVIDCQYVVIAAGFEAGPFLPKEVMQLTSTYVILSHPVDPRYLWPEHSLIWETSQPYLYIRTTGGNRIMVGGEDEELNDPSHRDALMRDKIQKLEEKFMKLFPHFTFTTEMAWCGTFSTTPDGLPFIGTWPGKERMYFALGYGGNGITFSMIAAQIIRNCLKNIKDERTEIFGFERIEE